MPGRDDDDARFSGPSRPSRPQASNDSTRDGDRAGSTEGRQADGAGAPDRSSGPFDRSRGGRQSFTERPAPPTAERSNAPDGQQDQDTLIPSVELPRGGAALRSIGETFETNAFTGTGSLTLPVPLSPARALTPSLTLSYDSGRGNGPFGLGWALSVPEISRRTDRGLPRYVDSIESDTFILAGAEDLVPLYDQGSRVVHETQSHYVYPYRPRLQSAFSRIDRWVSRTDGSTH